MEKCTKCGRELPESDFYKNTSTIDGLQVHCKSCQKEAQRVRVYGGGKAKSSEGSAELQHITARQLIEELRARGYSGKLIYTKEVVL